MTFETAFAKIKEKTANAKTDKLVGDFAIQINLTNKDCHGAFYISYFNGKLSVEPFDYVDRWALLSTSTVAFDKLITGALDVDAAIDEGKISVEGDVATVKQLTTLVRPAKKAPAKKPSSKTTTVKKQTAELVKKAEPAKKTVKKTADKAVKVAKEVSKKVSDKAKKVDTKKATDTVKKTTEKVVKKATDVTKKVAKKSK